MIDFSKLWSSLPTTSMSFASSIAPIRAGSACSIAGCCRASSRLSKPAFSTNWRIATPTTAAELADFLALDPGYLSRLLAGLAKRGFLSRRPSAKDRRAVVLGLTDAGRRGLCRTRPPLEGRGRPRCLAALPAGRRHDLVSAMATIERHRWKCRAIEHADPHPRAGRSGLDRRAPWYALCPRIRLRFGFRGLGGRDCREIPQGLRRRARALLDRRSWTDGASAASCWSSTAAKSPNCAYCWSNWMRADWVLAGGWSKSASRFAKAAGYREITLWTNSILDLRPAMLYESLGFVLVQGDAASQLRPRPDRPGLEHAARSRLI